MSTYQKILLCRQDIQRIEKQISYLEKYSSIINKKEFNDRMVRIKKQIEVIQKRITKIELAQKSYFKSIHESCQKKPFLI